MIASEIRITDQINIKIMNAFLRGKELQLYIMTSLEIESFNSIEIVVFVVTHKHPPEFFFFL
jgi:hypothetical protein